MTTIEHVRASRQHTAYVLADGTKVPGVTTIIRQLGSEAIVRWAHGLGKAGIEMNAYRDGLASIGTLAHALIIETLGGPAPDLDDYTPNEVKAAMHSFDKFRAWSQGKNIAALLREEQLVSETLRYGGTLDIYAEVDGETAVIDIKTGRAIYEESIIQVAAYRALLEERGLEVEAIRVLQVGRTDEEGFSEKVLRGSAIAPYWDLFEALLDIYHIRRGIAAGERAKPRRKAVAAPSTT